MSNANLIMETLVVNISEVEPDARNFRKNFDEKKLAELAADIRQNGLAEPLIVARSTGANKKPFVIKSGERRYRALIMNKTDLVKVQILPAGKTQQETDIMALVINIDRENLSTFEQAAAFALLVDEYKMSGSDIAKKTGKNVSYVNRLLKPYSELNPKIRNAWQDGHQLATVETLGKIVAKFPADEQLPAWQNLIEFGAFEAPEGDTDGDEDGGDKDGSNGKPDKTGNEFKVKSAQTLNRFNLVIKQVASEEKFDGVWVQSLLRFVVGKRAMPPEGIEMPEKKEKKPAPRTVRKEGTV